MSKILALKNDCTLATSIKNSIEKMLLLIQYTIDP
jgi:hypothetical protein